MKFHRWVFKILKKQNVTDARTDGRTDGQRENSIPPLKLRFGGGYNKTGHPKLIYVIHVIVINLEADKPSETLKKWKSDKDSS